MLTLRTRAALAALLALALAPAAPAQTWTGVTITESWNTSGNWDTNSVPNSATAVVTFPSLSGPFFGHVNIGSSVQAQSLTFSNTSGNYNITSDGGQTLSGVTAITIGAGVTGTQTINLANVASGSLLFANSGSLTVTNNATLGASPTLVIGPNTVIGTPGGGGVTVGGSGFTRMSGSFADTSAPDNEVTGGLTKTGAGRLELTGNNSHLFGSGFTVVLSGGTLAVNADAALGNSIFGLKLDVNSFTAGGLEFLNTGVTVARPVVLASTTRIVSNGTDGSTISGLISGSGQLVKDGTGTLTLSNGSNSYSGGVSIQGGTLRLGAAGALPAGADVIVASTATTLDLNGVSQTIGSLQCGGGTVLLGGGTLTVGANNAPGTLAGTISGTGSLNKTGTGTFGMVGGNGSSIGSLAVGGGKVALSDFSLTLTGATSPLTVGSGSPATLTIDVFSSVATTAGPVRIDGPALTGAAVTVSGGLLSAATDLAIGPTGRGSLSADSGASVVVGQALSIGGAGGSIGTLLVQSAASLTSRTATIGPSSGSTGTATVTGGSSSWSNTGAFDLGGVGASAGGTGTLTVTNGGAVTVGGTTTLLTSPSSITVNGGSLTTSSLASAAGATPSIFLTDPAGKRALTVGSDNTSTTYAGSIADAAGGPGTLAKVGAGTLTLTGHLTNTGGYAVTGGTLDFSGTVVQPGAGSLAAGAGTTIQYDAGAQVSGGFLRGPGTHVIGAGGVSFSGTTAFNGAVITQNNPVTLTNFTSSGAITSGAALTWNGGVQTASGSLTVNTAVSVKDFENDGTITVNPGGTLAVTGTSSLVLGGGSRTFVGSAGTPGGTVTAPAGVTIELNGGLLVNNGTIGSAGAGKVNINYGSLAKGSGNYAGGYSVNDGGRFSPGNSPGTVTSGPATWGAGGTYVWEINNATGTAGTHWDLSQITGTLTIAAGTTTNSKFTIAVTGLNSSNAPGLPANFDPSHSYQWTIATATSVTGFDPSVFALDTTGFVAPGSFALSQSSNSIVLSFAPVPEPAAVLGVCAVAAAGWVGFWRRRWA